MINQDQMYSTLPLRSFDDSLTLLRDNFSTLTKGVIDEVDKYISGLGASLNIADRDYFEPILCLKTKSFSFSWLNQLFEYLILYDYFNYRVNYSINVSDYIESDSFDFNNFTSAFNKKLSFLTAIKLLIKKISDILTNISIPDSILASHDDLSLFIKSIFSAKKSSFHHSGDYDFIVSLIPINTKGFILTNDFIINDNIFYTYDSTQILSMARLSKPGAYLIANIPYGKLVEVSFYILIVTAGDAYLIDSGKHSFRDQVYRTSSRGEDGETRFIDRKFDQLQFPIDLVINFFNLESSDTSIKSTNSDFSFKVLGKISESGPTYVGWIVSLVDQFIDTVTHSDFLDKISLSVSSKFIKLGDLPQSENLPSVSSIGIPSIDSLTWNINEVDVKYHPVCSLLDPLLVSLPVEATQIKDSPLTSFSQLKASLIFSKRKLEAENLERRLLSDYELNSDKVNSLVQSFIISKFNTPDNHFIHKALMNNSYPLRIYSTFSHPVDTDGSIQDSKILYTFLNRELVLSPDITFYGVNVPTLHNSFHIKANFEFDWNERYKCDSCGVKSSYRCIIRFIDILQFKSFFEIDNSDLSNLPSELNFLDPSRYRYIGNSILDDIDPIALIDIPWWGESLPQLAVSFHLCKRCYIKFSKGK